MNSYGFDHLFYLRLTEACNMRCDHCFIPNNPKSVSRNQVDDFVALVRQKAEPGSTVLIQFHGGEPTVLGQDNLSWWAGSIRARLPGYKCVFRIQTNLLIPPRQYADFLHEYCDGEIGISWDYKIRKLSRGADDRNAAYETTFWENFKTLDELGLSHFVVITGTKVFYEWASSGNTFIDWGLKNRIKKVHIERLTKVGYAVDSWDEIGVNNRDNSLYLSLLFKQYRRAREQGKDIFISPFDGLMGALASADQEAGYGCHSGICDTRFHTFDQNGYQPGCTAINSTDEVIEQIVSVYDPLDGSPIDMRRKERIEECGSCTYKSVCNSGCLATSRHDGSGDCSGGKILFNVISSYLKRVQV